MKDIAGQLGVSVALVSYVLNGKKTDKINAGTAARIKDLAAKMNYSPNQIAKSLKMNRTHTLGLIVADISNLFYSSIAKYIEEQANLHGYQVIYGSAHEDPDRFNSILQLLLSRQVDGLIIAVPEKAEGCIEQLKGLNKPFVIIDRKFYDFADVPTVLLNNKLASEEIVTHFAGSGYNRLGIVTINRNLVSLAERKQGFMDAAKALHLTKPFVYELEEDQMDTQMEQVIHTAIFKDKVDGLCFFTNKVAMTGLSMISGLGVAIPEELGIVCFDEAKAYDIFRKPVTYYRQPLEEMSNVAVDYLLNLVEDKGKGETVASSQVGHELTTAALKEFAGSLVVRESSLKKKAGRVNRTANQSAKAAKKPAAKSAADIHTSPKKEKQKNS